MQYVAEPSPGRRLRDLLAAPELVVAPGVYDGLSALVAAGAGFEALYVSGGAIARSTGVPDLGLVTMTEVLARLREVIDAVHLPVLADADTGYGGALNVARTVREMERLGVAGLHLEDQVTPKRCGHYGGKELVPAADMVGKLAAAVEARADPDLVLVARTDAIAVEGFDAALDRAGRYVAAGADLVFVEAPETIEQLARIAAEVPAPTVVNMFAGGRTPHLDAAEVERFGHAMMLVPSDLQRAALWAMQEAAAALRSAGSTRSVAGRLASFDERDDVVGLARYRDAADRYEGRP